ncbi:MAG: hypothetical protein DI551_00740 [Micavibrio aeruginosavorus]|uniref:Phage major capsid protein n=1 Tax=Micavibrio aeruginosavorus TaxID=349221 RepID=A0A2W5QBU8_9BACT|nr:MAG: hypothetical protein DI551_00740 [Micavibrio aeruginosavorus]
MSTSIDVAFIKQFEREVHEAYQRRGSKLRNTVRNVNNVAGASTVFQKVGKGTASTKSRHGMVPVMNRAHSNVECSLQDFYAGDWVDKLDELKINISERDVVTRAGASALGRATDQLIVDALDSLADAGQIIVNGGTGMTLAKATKAIEIAGQNDVFEEGEMWAVVGWKQWTELLAIEEFANADYVGADSLPFKDMMTTTPKSWLGATWIPHSGLTLNGNVRSGYIYHKNSLGHASGSDVQSDITWHGDRASHFINNMMSQGAVLIDPLGAIRIECQE